MLCAAMCTSRYVCDTLCVQLYVRHAICAAGHAYVYNYKYGTPYVQPAMLMCTMTLQVAAGFMGHYLMICAIAFTGIWTLPHWS